MIKIVQDGLRGKYSMKPSWSGRDVGRILRLLSNPVNLELLILLNTKPSYPRELARLTGRDETDVSRRLKLLEKAGLVEGSWRKIGGRNIRMYRLSVRGLRIDFVGGGVKVSGTPGSAPAHEARSLFSLEAGPPRQRLFVGRRGELEKLRSAGTPIVVVWGMSGIGKTSLVAKAFEDLGKLYWHTLSRLDTPEYVLWRLAFFLSGLGYSRLLNYLGTPGRSVELAADMAVEGLSAAGATLVFDDYHVVEGSEAGALVRRLAKRSGGYRVVIVSRRRPRGLPYHEPGMVSEILLKGLSPPESEELLRRRGVELEPGELAEVYAATAGHPLLLHMFAEAYRSGGLSRYRGEAARYLWREVYSALPEPERRLLSILAAFEDPQPPELIAELSGIRSPEPHLYRLADRGLVEQLPEGFRAYPLVASLLGRAGRRDLRLKAAEYYARRGGWINRLRAMKYYMEAGRPDLAAGLVAGRVLRDDYTYLSYLDSYKMVVDELARAELPPRLRLYVAHDAALLERQKGRIPEATRILEEAVDRAEGLGDPVVLANLALSLSYIYADLGRVEESLRLAERGLRIAEEVGDNRLTMAAYANMVKALAMGGQLDEAYEYLVKELKVAEDLGDPFYVVWSRIHLGELQRMRGRLGEAERSAKEAYMYAEELGLKHPQAFAALVLAEIYEATGDAGKMLKYAEACERILTELGMIHRLSSAKFYRAKALAALGRPEEALAVAEEALRVAEKMGDTYIVPMLRWLLGDTLMSMGRTGEGLKHLSLIPEINSWTVKEACRKAAETLKRAGMEHETPRILGKCLGESE